MKYNVTYDRKNKCLSYFDPINENGESFFNRDDNIYVESLNNKQLSINKYNLSESSNVESRYEDYKNSFRFYTEKDLYGTIEANKGTNLLSRMDLTYYSRIKIYLMI